MEPVTIVGNYLSPYVRKVLVCLRLKGIEYRVDPIVPFYGNDEFSRLSPVRRIPVLIDGDLSLCDSTVICEYLEERTPEPPLYPKPIAERARARWLEEFADTRMGEVFIWRLYNERVIRRFVWGEKTDEAVVANALENEIPEILDYLEGQLPGEEGFLFGEVGVADVAVATFFRNAAFAGYQPDAGRFPRTSAFVERMLGLPAFLELRPFEEACMKVPITKHREALAEVGAPLSDVSFFTPEPRRGVMTI